jgi:hypothetical protein
LKKVGIIILIIGIVMTLYTGFSFVTKEKVVEVGSIAVTKDNEHSANWSPFVGVGLTIIGAIVIVRARKK